MQRLSLNQSLQQRLSPQQIQFIKLLQIPTVELDARIEEELEINPALEDGMDEDVLSDDRNDIDDEYDDFNKDKDLDIDSYLQEEEYNGYKMYGDGFGSAEDDHEMPITTITSLSEMLMTQLGYLRLDERQQMIGIQLIGSIESDGYIRRQLQAIANDLAFTQSVYTNTNEIQDILKKIQTFDPAGIGAVTLQECLLLQLDRKPANAPFVQTAIKIVEKFFEEFSKKHYVRIQKKLNINDEELSGAMKTITRLNPKPGGAEGESFVQYLLPDFLLTNNNGKLEIILNSKNAPDLRVSRSFSEMLNTYDKGDKTSKSVRETIQFVKQKLDAAKWFIDAIKQRQATLLKTMHAIVHYQYSFFLDGDESKLKPMILKDIATIIDMDISTVSRVANSKSIQTEFGIYPLKYFFSEGIETTHGEDASSREVKNIVRELIDEESKTKPISDEKIEEILNERGYNIARRTVAKYREQLNIPVARLRKRL